jgi:hypothetical protein
MLPFRSGRSWKWGASAAIFALGILNLAGETANPTASPEPTAKKIKGAIAPGAIPLPIGHEAKGLVLPDYDLQGHLQARFEAKTAKRLDVDRIQFTGLKMTTFTPENTLDLAIDLPTAVLNLTTHLMSSQTRTTIRRADFEIAGDTMRFDTVARKGTLVGHVKMVINNDSRLMGKSAE